MALNRLRLTLFAPAAAALEARRHHARHLPHRWPQSLTVGYSLRRSIMHCSHPPRCIVIAGPNGSGKTTFAREYLPGDAGVIHFVNADLIAGGLAPLRPQSAAVAAGRIFVAELERLAASREDFAFETTLSGRSHLARLRRWREAGYRLEMIFLRLSSPAVAMRRIATRVRQGGHDVPHEDVLRRFDRGWANFQNAYRSLMHAWAVYDTSGATPRLLERSA